MINKDSIVTAYDEHLTLVEWLQKVEKALDNAVLTNLGIAKLSDQNNVATYRVTATFADNTTIVSDTFTLPSTNIVTAFNDLTALVNGFDDRITDNTNDVASILNIIDVANDKIKASTLQNSINGSNEVIVDIDATNDKLEIHLSDELQAKLARVLLKSLTPPSTRKVVTIDTNGAQDNVDPTELPTLMNNIVDNHGNPRFIEGNITTTTIEGFTQTYGKWSLSGTHLMIVITFTVDANTILPSNAEIARITLPQFILDKIVSPNQTAYIDIKEFYMRGKTSWWQATYTLNILLSKSSNRLSLNTTSAIPTITNDCVARIQFDLLIDSE